MAVRLAEIVGALSLATDLANGFPLEKTLRTAILATRLSAALGHDEALRRDVFYTAVLRFVGCTAWASEEAALAGGDDIALRRALQPMDGRATAAIGRVWRDLGGTRRARAGAVARAIARPGAVAAQRAAACEAAVQLVAPIGLPDGVAQALTEVFERPDGRGAPRGLDGDTILPAARVVAVADLAEQLVRAAGRDGARTLLGRRAGRQLDAAMVRAFLADDRELGAGLDAPSSWRTFLDAEPGPPLVAEGGRVDDVARSFARFVDVRSRYTLGHSESVAALAERVAGALGVAGGELAAVRRAALLHDLGTIATPLGTWDKRGAHDPVERERVRGHAWQTERILAVAPELAGAARIAGAHHERLDGSGYHRGATAAGLDVGARALAVADVWHALRQARPHRPARTEPEAIDALAAEARAGRLDARCVDAALAAVGAPARATPWPAGLSDREVEVVRLVAVGRTNPEIARVLGISAKTAQHHVSHVFDKLGVASRAGAALAAMQLGLVE